MKVEKASLQAKIESYGLFLIAVMMVVFYWIFDVISSGHYLTRTLIAALVIGYGLFTQNLINSRKEALEEKERTQKQLIQAEKLAALGAVAAGVAHEVKNPIAIIVQGSEFLKKVLHEDERLLDVAARIEKSALRADNIVKGLLSFSREISLKREELDLSPIIDEALSFVEHMLEEKRIKVRKQYAPDLPKIVMDSTQIKQVLTNLFMNSLEAMPEGGMLAILTDTCEDQMAQPCVRIVVSDTGQGISEELLRKVFDPFFTTKNDSKNTGLGLSISKGIIDKHRGTIKIDSEHGRGTRITVLLPTEI